MKVLVTGGNGQLAHDVMEQLKEHNIEYRPIDLQDADITNESEIRDVILAYQPTAVIHCAAYTAVDNAEDNQDLVFAINVLGTEYIAKACREVGAKMVYISTDYTFDGQGDRFFEVDDVPSPINWYGKTKYEGELKVKENLDQYFIVRISWVFGVHGNNFVKTMIRLGNERDSLNVVNDQIGSPTYTADVAPLLVEMIQTDKYGVYHATNEGICSWYDFTKEIFRLSGIDCVVTGIPSSQYPTKAARPMNSRMSKQSLKDAGFKQLRPWQEALADMIEKLS